MQYFLDPLVKEPGFRPRGPTSKNNLPSMLTHRVRSKTTGPLDSPSPGLGSRVHTLGTRKLRSATSGPAGGGDGEPGWQGASGPPLPLDPAGRAWGGGAARSVSAPQPGAGLGGGSSNSDRVHPRAGPRAGAEPRPPDRRLLLRGTAHLSRALAGRVFLRGHPARAR